MLNKSVLKISVLVFTFFLNALIVSSDLWNCIGAYSAHGVCGQTLDPGNSQIRCDPRSCYNRAENTRNVRMYGCTWEDQDVPGLSYQDCVEYDWASDGAQDGKGSFTCTNPSGQTYDCEVDPSKVGYISCDTCYRN
ncbi:uncharacterized protein MELLADRAFT_124162 [Melampsora larici-populina 98AG31]|uniref:Secreted protein n=1 Tax=Melampsora larici-populina (strain 98AG31 / pathotype 3-4-7) TaxID=747676 RepID=F4RM75_MELLP|nr:uncharacterized protein MELLADRAFT_124162 [Melampsora larici-populina 98AG31]EGG06373.1 secreted protein [Melampsora larici-populina 98AG31]